MEEFKGTKGAWSLRTTIKGNFNVSGIGWYDFAKVNTLKDGSLEDKQEALANAKLIAAAPDMLKALELIACNSNDSVMIKTAIKAIKKAIG